MGEKEKERLKKFQDLCNDTLKNEIKVFMIPAYSADVEWLDAGQASGWKSKLKKQKMNKQMRGKGKGPMSLELLEWIKMIEEKVKVMKFDKYNKLVDEFPKV